MSTVLYPIFTAINGILLPIGFWIYSQTQSFEMLLLLVLMAGITYDNLIISIGRWLGEGNLLLWISQPRFFSIFRLPHSPLWLLSISASIWG
ncbi:MAG: hypothetical protein HC924_16305 [Synechococcaceae cyanobacterium SM2_3_2]|nr:hypothetical protein [Synechococcaceae cyanobacterium SM2_3_2]